ncbi:MAG: YceI family protein [Planctomycetes bacterium]|nr:YceI family protein [Planctomycetota bacterium]
MIVKPLLKKTLIVVGYLTLLGACFLSGAAVMTLRDRVEVRVTSKGDEDPMVTSVKLLEDDVVSLRSDLERLTQAIDSNFGKLAEVLSQPEEVTVDRRLHAKIDALAQELAKRPTVVMATPVASDAPAATASMPVEGTADASTDLSDDLVPDDVAISTDASESSASTPSSAEPEVAGVVAEPEPTPKKKSFLSFSVPKNEIDLDSVQRFSILGSLSRVGFDAKSTLHDFSGATTTVTGDFDLAVAAPDLGCRGRVEADARTIRTGVDGRDEEMRSLLLVDEHPQLRFELDSLEVGEVDREKSRVTGTVHGTLAIAGVSKPLAMPVTITLDRSRRLTVDGQCPVKVSDFGITPPSQLGMINMEDQIQIWIALKARSLGPAQATAATDPK